MKLKKTVKPVLVTLIVSGLVGGGLYFGYSYNQSKKVVKVVPLENIAITEYWGDNIESYGQVTSDKSQMGYLPKGAEVASVSVSEGEHVEAGQPILNVKKEFKDIKNKNLEILKADQALKVEQLKLQRLMDTKPVPEYVYSQDVYADVKYKEAVEYYVSSDDVFSFKGVDYEKGERVAAEYFSPSKESLGMTVYIKSKNADGSLKKDEKGETVFSEEKLEKDEAKVIRDSSQLSTKDIEGTLQYIRSTSYFDAETGKLVGETSYTVDGKIDSEQKVPTGMNAKELAEEIAKAEESVKKQDLAMRKLKSELETMENSTDDGTVVAKISGTVSKLQSADNYNNTQPFFIITATDEYYITGSIGEYYLGQINIGDPVSISSWETGNSAEAIITSISDTPVKSDDYWHSGNSNSSYYEFKASFDKSSGIEIGTAVDISITPSDQQESGLYLPKYLIKKDASGNYVMKRNKKGVLEKVYVEIGKTVWGNMTQVKSGITIDDMLAFPYGNGDKEGVKCEKSDSFEDYGSYEGGLG